MSEEEKLCDVCHKRPATHHTCYGHTGETRDLCRTCFEQTSSGAELDSLRNFEERIRNGKCKYCGAPAAGGCGGSMPFAEDILDLWCEPCQRDLAEFGKMPENAIPEFPSDDEAAQERVWQQQLDRERRREEFMKQRLAQRRGRANG